MVRTAGLMLVTGAVVGASMFVYVWYISDLPPSTVEQAIRHSAWVGASSSAAALVAELLRKRRIRDQT